MRGRPIGDSLKFRERRFALEFVKSWNAKTAGLAVGFGEKSIDDVWAFRKRPGVQRVIDEEMEKLCKAARVSGNRVINELCSLAFTVMTDYASWTPQSVSLTNSEDLTRAQAGAIQSVSSKISAQGVPNVSIKLYDKIKALEMLARFLGLIGSDNDGSRPGGQELAIRIRAMLKAANEATLGAEEVSKKAEKETDG